MSQVRRLGPKVGSRLALLCIHHMNRVNSRNDSESWCQHHKHCPGIVVVVVVVVVIIIIAIIIIIIIIIIKTLKAMACATNVM